MPRLATALARAVIVLALPLLLFFGGLIWVVLDVGTYEKLFFGYGAAERTGLGPDELRAVAAAFAEHFRNGTPITLTVVKNGQQAPMFTEREIVHLRDIHHLLRFGIRALTAIGAAAVLAAVAGLRLWRGKYVANLSGALMGGGLLTLGLLAAIGLGILVAFDRLFWIFHEISFPNDFWLLDPRQHYLINLMARDFYIDTALGVAAWSAVVALALALVGGVVWWRANHGPAGRRERAGAQR